MAPSRLPCDRVEILRPPFTGPRIPENVATETGRSRGGASKWCALRENVRLTQSVVRPPNVGRLSCGEAPNACGAIAARLPRFSSKNAMRSASGMTSHLGSTEGLQPRERKTARRQLRRCLAQRRSRRLQRQGKRRGIGPTTRYQQPPNRRPIVHCTGSRIIFEISPLSCGGITASLTFCRTSSGLFTGSRRIRAISPLSS
jgi:hypothetical protein